jgi:hypothetical protein
MDTITDIFAVIGVLLFALFGWLVYLAIRDERRKQRAYGDVSGVSGNVHLLPSVTWECPGCKQYNTLLLTMVEVTQDDYNQDPETYDDPRCSYMLQPTQVQCDECGRLYTSHGERPIEWDVRRDGGYQD